MLRPLDADAPRDVGPFRLLAGLGSGGMGTVHLAVPHGGGPHDLVALKTVRRDLEAEGDFRIRFRREAEAARAVRSPHVSALVDADSTAERPWLATQYVAGPALDETVARLGPLPAHTVKELGADLARGLAAVHGSRLVHRDLKPANVVLGGSGPRVIDFGIAQAYDATALTATGVMVGSPGFMSPEHIAGNRSVTAASDVFCLGAVLCYAAAGHGPFEDSELAAIVYRISTGDADLSGLPDELREIVSRCLRQDPDERPTTGELVDALDPAAASARPGGPSARRTGPFPWPDGVRQLIHTYETAAGRALLAAPTPDAPPSPPATPPSPMPPPPTPDKATPRARPRRPWRRWAVAAGVGALVGTLTAVLLTVQNRDNGNGGPQGGSSGPAASPRPGAVQPAAPPVSSEMGDFGPRALDRTLQPDGWRPWTASFEPGGEAVECALAGGVLLCGLYDERRRASWMEARNPADGTHLWRYPAKGAPGDSERGVGLRGFDVHGRHAYVASSDQAGFDVLDLTNGKQVARLPGRSGYDPMAVRVHKGRVFASYSGDAGIGAAGNMLFRAFSLDDREQLWERVIPHAFTPSLDIVGDRLWLTGLTETQTLSPRTGRTLARHPGHCELPSRGAPYVSCDGVRDARTLKKLDDDTPGTVVAASRDGLILVENRSGGPRGARVQAHDIRGTRGGWSFVSDVDDPVAVVGDRVVTLGARGLRVFTLADGTLEASAGTFVGWPLAGGGTPVGGGASVGRPAQPGTAIVSGGAFYVTFEDGTVLSAPMP
ncbi:serine/threonine-protein kinase [Streptomyces durbertensis]|uniref:Serine/threonine-protein kinase n=1 Tax=Streptomyces durbertensis TaxID=2448886 RepID=A0ABR6EAK1_9ACTN|nr:serine/threonine-protein kinase [Streptomyces durbertensis]MBB1242173.1 serine/threonine-protein kinase [Streptomyces durbertensis]